MAPTASGFDNIRLALLDCCSLLNLYATRHMTAILQALPWRCVVADIVANEAHYVLRGGSGDDASERDPVELNPLMEKGLLEVWRPDSEAEYSDFVNFAAEIDDGEAVTCALALHRGAALVTDERKTLRILTARAPQLITLTTSQLLKYWAESVPVEQATLRAVLTEIQTRARFIPSKRDPLVDWWKDTLLIDNYLLANEVDAARRMSGRAPDQVFRRSTDYDLPMIAYTDDVEPAE